MPHPNKLLREYKKLHRFYENGAIFTAIDTETTGNSSKTCRIIEIGAVMFSKNGIIKTYNKLFNPECYITPFITDLTHITNEMVASCPPLKNHIKEFIDFVDDSILIAHNARFDLNFINMECEKAGLKETKNNAIDTLQYSRWAFPDTENHRLSYLADYFQIDKGNSHRALDDAYTCMNLFLKCVEKGISLSYEEPLQDQ